MKVWQPLLIAVQFLTIIPVRISTAPAAQTMGQSLLYYPLVGLLLGAILVAISTFGNALSASLLAALILACWILLTGALHLDGLADSADAWLGGIGNPDKTLAIMKDPYCGPIAVVTLIIVLLIKFNAIEQLIVTHNTHILFLAPLIARSAVIALFLTTPYVRKQGLGSALAEHLPRRSSWILLSSIVALLLVLPDTHMLGILVAVSLTVWLLRALMLRRLAGTTGDTAGALIEISETVVLASACIGI